MYARLPLGVTTSISSCSALPINARPSGDDNEIRFCAPSTSSGTTISNSAIPPSSRSSSRTRLPRPTVSRGIVSRSIIVSSAIRVSRLPTRARRNSWRCLAIAHSAFSDRSPCARARSSSLGRSTVSSCLSVSRSFLSRLITGSSAIDSIFLNHDLLSFYTIRRAGERLNALFLHPGSIRDDRRQAPIYAGHALNLVHDQLTERGHVRGLRNRDYVMRPRDRVRHGNSGHSANLGRDFPRLSR